MSLNFSALLNELLEGLVFYVYAHVRAMYLVMRFPIRGPRYLARINARQPAKSVGPHGFFLINLIAVFFLIQIAPSLTSVDLKTVAGVLGSQIERVANSEVDWFPLILWSLAILVTADVALRLACLTVPVRRHRQTVRNSLLFSLGLQPWGALIGCMYLLRFVLSTNYAILVLGPTLALVLAFAAPTIAYFASAMTSFISRIGRRLALGLVGIATIAFIAGLYVEAGALVFWQVGSPPDQLEITNAACVVDSAGNTEITAVVENLTKQRFTLASSSAFSTFMGDKNVKTSSVETSLGKDAPFLIINDGAVLWIRLKGMVPSPIAVNEDCLIRILNGSFIIGTADTYWTSSPTN
jgi:hypothetical protein